MSKTKAKAGKASKTGKKKPVKVKKFTENELKALELVALHPNRSNHAIGREMKDLGLVKDPAYLNHRLQSSSAMQEKTTQLQEKGKLKFAQMLPQAAKGLKTYLKAVKPPLKAIDIAAKYGLGRPDEAQPRIDTIHIDTLNILQSNQLSTITQRLGELEPDE